MAYYVARSSNKFEATQDGLNVFEVDVIDRKGQPPVAVIKKILIGGLKDSNVERISTGWRNI